ncbi:hypothetical protein SAMN05192558_12176 [Actinokineospora alba]|uniref:Major facilitator superfamily (MFS) profile domain-containing protein n=1 Tax=Actinokineospora alba TaxID=504798 RepID=A0A1H0WH66_9PSEU|nr:hypothetical protein [Actinokineospora alba]TDP65352.1 hypothetical protein C8E96_0834 [Actinokineospora alba]SDH60267.1 hypothetical protein SAMN05421871_101656 [Actinokineospora alba]SDP90070.1 hypothetical protein SAMN05192558_12176 [Actinokineospora alba]
MTTASLTATQPATLLRRFLTLDALVSGGNGLAYVIAPVWIGDLLGVSTGALVPIGIALVVFGLAVGAIAMSRNPLRGAGFVIEFNLAWVVASLAVAAFNPFGANTIGVVWTVMQAGTVAVFAGLQWMAVLKAK